MSTIDDARTLIEQGIAEIDEEQDRLARSLIHLGGGSAPKRRQRGSGGRSARQTGSKRAAKGQRRGEVLDAIRKQPGIKVSQVAKKMGVKPQPLYAIAKQLEKDGEIKKDGTGYKTTPRSPAAKRESKAKAAKAKGTNGKGTDASTKEKAPATTA